MRRRLLFRKKHLKETWDRHIGWLARKAWASGVRQAARLLGSGRFALKAMEKKAAQLAAEFVISTQNEVHTTKALWNLRERVPPLTSRDNLPSRVEYAYNNLVLALETDIRANSSHFSSSSWPLESYDRTQGHFVLWLCPQKACWREALGSSALRGQHQQSWTLLRPITTLVLLCRPAPRCSEAMWRQRCIHRTEPRGALFFKCYRKCGTHNVLSTKLQEGHHRVPHDHPGILKKTVFRCRYPEHGTSPCSTVNKSVVSAAARQRACPEIWAPMAEIREKLRRQKLIVGHRPSHLDKLIANPDEIVVQ